MSSSHSSQVAVPDLGSGKVRTRRLVRTIGVAAALVGAAAIGFAVGGHDEPADSVATARPVQADPVLAVPEWSERIGLKYLRYPAWFREVARLYGHDPRLTPDFDFASLYSVPAGNDGLARDDDPKGR